MSGANELVRTLADRRILLGRRGETLRVVSLRAGAVTPEIEAVLRTRKAELLEFLSWQDRADELLLESTRRLGLDYPSGCPLDTEEWARHDSELHEAYWSGDLSVLRHALDERERFARRAFEEFRRERAGSP